MVQLRAGHWRGFGLVDVACPHLPFGDMSDEVRETLQELGMSIPNKGVRLTGDRAETHGEYDDHEDVAVVARENEIRGAATSRPLVRFWFGRCCLFSWAVPRHERRGAGKLAGARAEYLERAPEAHRGPCGEASEYDDDEGCCRRE